MSVINLDVGNEIEFTFEGKTYKAKLPTVRDHEDRLLELYKKIQEHKDDKEMSNESLNRLITLLHNVFPVFPVDVLKRMSFHQIGLIQKAMVDKLPKNEESPAPVAN